MDPARAAEVRRRGSRSREDVEISGKGSPIPYLERQKRAVDGYAGKGRRLLHPKFVPDGLRIDDGIDDLRDTVFGATHAASEQALKMRGQGFKVLYDIQKQASDRQKTADGVKKDGLGWGLLE